MEMRDVLSELGIPTAPEGHHHSSAGRIQIDCPYCSPGSGRWRMGVRDHWSYYCSCWTCGSHRTADALAESANVPIFLVIRHLRHLPKDLGFKPPSRHTGSYRPPGMVGGLARPHKNFLSARGFNTKEITRLWRIRGIGMHPRFPWSIFIPITYEGEVVSFTTRNIYREGWRYKSATPDEEKYPHKSLLYGEEYCTNTVVVVEGPLDVWALGPGAVCTFGTSYSSDQLLKLSRYPRRLIAFDNEPEAQRVADQLCRDLDVFDGETINVKFSTGKDASRATKEEIEDFKRQFFPSNPR